MGESYNLLYICWCNFYDCYVYRLVGEEGVWFMFIGLVEEMGNVKEVWVLDDGGFIMMIEVSVVLENVRFGDSIVVNGMCLIVI